MKRIFIALVAAFALVGCAQDDADKKISSLITSIYSDVDAQNLVHKFCSKDYVDLYDQVIKIDDALSEEGLIGYYDYNHWIHAQDMSGYSFEIESIDVRKKEACAEVLVNNCGQQTSITLSLVKEGNDWKVDDLKVNNLAYNPQGGVPEKDLMRKFIKENK